MLDIFNIPNQQDSVSTFYARGTTDWQTWQKPRNCKFIWIMCIGSGTGGIAGASGTGVPGTYQGGQGGNSGAVTRALFPANALPDTLFVQPGPGGIGGPTPGGGARSFVSTSTLTLVTRLVCVSGNAAAGSPVLTNTVETIATVASANLLNLATFVSLAGLQGANQSDITPLSSTIVTGGGYGGIATATTSTSFSMLSTAFSPAISSAGVNSGTAIRGSSFVSQKPFFAVGGSGGGAFFQNAGGGGAGGEGGFGCGGGGGGAAYNGAGGGGGKGGDGLIIINWF